MKRTTARIIACYYGISHEQTDLPEVPYAHAEPIEYIAADQEEKLF